MYYRFLNGFKERIASKPKTLILAHRGLSSKHLENTVEALSEAMLAGVDGVEFDVQLSRDLLPLVFHDKNLARLTGINKDINSLLSSELTKIRQSSKRYSQSYAISSLEEVLAKLPDNTIANIELKESFRESMEGIRRLLDVTHAHRERLSIIISSFDPQILEMVAHVDQNVRLGLLIDNKEIATLFRLDKSLLRRISFLHPHILLLNPINSAIIRALNVNLIIWGHKKLGDEKFLLADGHYALISDISEKMVKDR
jgi:glycerophosphoryl diester phosphodiesterase